jgi:hypothetical protein
MTKQHILQEIKRIALANDGNSPGQGAFYKATGIKASDWRGKYWVRWSEALQEAGFAPNQMTVGYKKDLLIEKLISLAREIGRFPVASEVQIEAFKSNGFPAYSTFKNHFGSKGQLVSKVAEYCRLKTGLEDVIRMCEAASPKIETETETEEESESSEKIGSVYLMKHGRYYKIGKTNSIGRREYDLAIQMPEKLTTIHVIKTDDPDGIEAYWHRRFAAKRKGGEWFDLTAADVKAFKKWLRIV